MSFTKKEKQQIINQIDSLSFVIDCFIRYSTNEQLFGQYVKNRVDALNKSKEEKSE